MSELSEAWFAAVVPRRARCVVCGDVRDRPVQGHHPVERQWIRKRFPFGGVGGEFGLLPVGRYDEPEVPLEELLWDKRNGMAVGLRCHERHTLAVVRIPLSKVPQAVLVFAAWLGLLWRLEGAYACG